MSPLFLALRRSYSSSSLPGSISRAGRLGGARLPTLSAALAAAAAARAPALPPPAGAAPAAPLPAPPSSLAAPSDTALPDEARGAAESPTARVLADLAARGRVHAATLALVERTPEWRNYESQVNFELNVLRMRYATTPGTPMTPQRRAQMQAHLRAAQRKAMEEHADRAAAAFVEGLAPGEAAALRTMVARLDTPGVGQAVLERASDAPGASAERLRVQAEELRDALWDLSSLVGGQGKK
jgi:hypothetical protein